MTLREKVEQSRNNLLSNKGDYLPMPSELGKIAKWMPGFVRGDISCFTGTPSSGKTSLVKFIFLHHGVKWAVNNKKNLKIKYFGLEETFDEMEWSLLSHQLYMKRGVRYNIRDFTGVGSTVAAEHLMFIDELEPRLNTIKSYVDYHDNIFNSFGIYKEIRDFARSRGKFYLGGVQLTNSQLIEGEKWDKYIPDDPEEFVVIIVDHLLDMLTQKEEKDLSDAMSNIVKMLKNYAAKLFNYCVVFVQHQDNSVDNFERRQAQDILCTIPNLARNKELGRQYKNLIGVTNVNVTNSTNNNSGIQIWNGYRIPQLGNFSRVLNIIKNRFGTKDVNDIVYFDGKVGSFENLPKPDSEEFKRLVEKIKIYDTV